MEEDISQKGEGREVHGPNAVTTVSAKATRSGRSINTTPFRVGYEGQIRNPLAVRRDDAVEAPCN